MMKNYPFDGLNIVHAVKPESSIETEILLGGSKVPKFLENKLRAEYGNNPRAIFGTMNSIGAMRGNRETAKGRAMQKKHDAKVSRRKRGK